MPYKSFWMQEHYTILSDVRGNFTIREFKAMVDENLTYIDQVDHLVHIILDTRKLQRGHFNIRDIHQMGLPAIHPNTGWNLIISANPLITFLSSVIVQLLQNVRYRHHNDMETTLTFLASVEPFAQTLTIEKINALADSWESS